jgi:hypothetical protein
MERVAPGAKRFTLGARERRGLVALDPRAILGVLAAASAVAFMSKSPAVELALVASVALLQALCGHVRMALGYLGCYGALWAILTFVFPNVGGIAATMFTISLTFSRKVFLCLMRGRSSWPSARCTGCARRWRACACRRWCSSRSR